MDRGQTSEWVKGQLAQCLYGLGRVVAFTWGRMGSHLEGYEQGSHNSCMV